MRGSGKAENNDESLPIASLRLLAPPMRLVSAAVWKVMQQRDVMQYGKLEEFVTSVSESVPGLLSYRHQAKLTVGLRAQFILQQLRVSSSPDPDLIVPHLERLRAPPISKGKRKIQKVELAVKNFHTLVHTLLKNPERRKQFFQEEFDSQYGPQYDLAVEKLLWEFLTRLDQLLPVPDLAQTVSWLSSAPAVLEECARSASQPQLLSTLLQHEKCLGHLDSAASFPSSVGESILSSLSLPPSGRVRDTNQSGSTSTPSAVLSPALSAERSGGRKTRSTSSQIAPVIGTISSKDLPQSTSANQDESPALEMDTEDIFTGVNSSLCQKSKSLQEDVSEEEHCVGNMFISVVSQSSSTPEEDYDEDDMRPVRRSSRSRRISETGKRETRKSSRVLEQNRKSNEEGLKNSSKNSPRTVPDSKSQKDKPVSAVLSSSMKRHLTVNIPKLDISKITQPVLLNTSANHDQTPPSPCRSSPERACRVRNSDSVNRKRKLSCMSTPEKNLTTAVNTQICAGSPCIPNIMTGWPDSPGRASPVIDSTDDIIVDSEDEATEKVKGRLFTSRYSKTKNNTYVPTLHEFWTPAFFRRDLVSPGNGCR
ncbi:TERF1-interacting nuclear factor 2 [Astyanax mexicanus]|uniref:TERF1-interacting nuclear factor 2 n=1 Tax=Astyanax mexicanus TaxID=7994 RepID=UPI000BBDB186|nr:TERF1-interacting nuclear factor 2 [Astyanax mexicanus]